MARMLFNKMLEITPDDERALEGLKLSPGEERAR
jgi:hypothetical protein